MTMAMRFSPITLTPPSSLSKSSFYAKQIPISLPKPIHVAVSSSVTIMMSKKVEEIKEIRGKTNEEINEEVVDLKGELFMLRLQKAARNEFKQSEFRRMRKRVARLLTIKRERELEEGINKRLSRKLDREWRKSIVPRPPPSLVKLKEEEAAAEAKESA
ncbi:ribosomal protein [Lithospermum erythrorhizon]|uniref:Large ribosomal subunit protein uL29c n=1 Tax=Lithospermum erythrorhizon TaxID=34254 RepID=A0AAV3NKZ9_LITER